MRANAFPLTVSRTGHGRTGTACGLSSAVTSLPRDVPLIDRQTASRAHPRVARGGTARQVGRPARSAAVGCRWSATDPRVPIFTCSPGCYKHYRRNNRGPTTSPPGRLVSPMDKFNLDSVATPARQGFGRGRGRGRGRGQGCSLAAAVKSRGPTQGRRARCHSGSAQPRCPHSRDIAAHRRKSKPERRFTMTDLIHRPELPVRPWRHRPRLEPCTDNRPTNYPDADLT